MPKNFTDLTSFKAEQPWGSINLALIEGASVRLHWTDTPYKWHINEGSEVFMVISGEVDMKYKIGEAIHSVQLGPLDVFVAEEGDEHVAHPIGEARILVIEKQNSV